MISGPGLGDVHVLDARRICAGFRLTHRCCNDVEDGYEWKSAIEKGRDCFLVGRVIDGGGNSAAAADLLRKPYRRERLVVQRLEGPRRRLRHVERMRCLHQTIRPTE